MSYVYVKSEPGLWTVGFYKPSGEWEPESDHSSTEDAAQRVAWLNGSQDAAELAKAIMCAPIRYDLATMRASIVVKDEA